MRLEQLEARDLMTGHPGGRGLELGCQGDPALLPRALVAWGY